MTNWSVYLLRCADGSLYCGVTTDIKRRLRQHNEGTASKYTRSCLPVKVLCYESGFTKSKALKIEYRIKQLPKRDKLKTFHAIINVKRMSAASCMLHEYACDLFTL